MPKDLSEGLPADPFEALVILADRYDEWYKQLVPSTARVTGSDFREIENNIETAYEFVGLAQALLEAVGERSSPLDLSCDAFTRLQKISMYFSGIRTAHRGAAGRSQIERAKTKYSQRLGISQPYEFTDGDLARLQVLVNELRDAIQGCEQISPNHKARLLARLEKLQRELHKRMSDLQDFWSVCVEASAALGQCGQNLKPLVDRIGELMKIAYNTYLRSNQLLSTTPLPRIESDDSPEQGPS